MPIFFFFFSSDKDVTDQKKIIVLFLLDWINNFKKLFYFNCFTSKKIFCFFIFVFFLQRRQERRKYLKSRYRMDRHNKIAINVFIEKGFILSIQLLLFFYPVLQIL